MGDDRFLSNFFKVYYGFTSLCVMATGAAILSLKRIQYFIGNWSSFFALAYVCSKWSPILSRAATGIIIINLQLQLGWGGVR